MIIWKSVLSVGKSAIFGKEDGVYRPFDAKSFHRRSVVPKRDRLQARLQEVIEAQKRRDAGFADQPISLRRPRPCGYTPLSAIPVPARYDGVCAIKGTPYKRGDLIVRSDGGQRILASSI